MRICLYSETVLPKLGGQEMVVDALARHMLALDHDVVVLAPRPRRRYTIDDGRLPYRVVRHPRIYSTHRFVSWYRYFLQKLYRSWPFDVLHCHSVFPCGYLASLCHDRWSVPTIITSHGDDVRAGNVRMSKPLGHERHVQSVQSADALVAISGVTAEGLRRLGARSEQLVTIPNGVELTAFAHRPPRPMQLDPLIGSGDYVLFLGRLHRRKGVDILLDALAKVPCSRPHVQLVIAGDGEERPTLEAQAQRLGLSDRVRFVGAVSGATKVWLLQNARALGMATRGAEAFPLVVLEAFAAGLAVIGPSIPGLVELVEPHETGLLVPSESVDEFARALGDALQCSSQWKSWGTRARSVADEHAWSSIAERHIALYRRLIEQRGQRRAA